jgi:hypothetical protein
VIDVSLGYRPGRKFWLSVLTENGLSVYTPWSINNIATDKISWRGTAQAMDRVNTSTQRKDKWPAAAVDTTTINFKVTPEFKKEFKGYAVSQGITMVELLRKGFALSKREREQ